VVLTLLLRKAILGDTFRFQRLTTLAREFFRLNRGRGSLGEVRIGHEQGHTLIEYADNAGSQLSIRWAEDRGAVSIADRVSDLTGNAQFDLQAFRWVRDPQFVRLEEEKGLQFELAAAVFADVQESKRPRKAVLSRTTDSGCPTATSGDNVGLVACGGFRCRGWGVAASGSLCCEEAAWDASFCCTNMACWGCCDFGSCDEACALGRYICFCGIRGTSLIPHYRGKTVMGRQERKSPGWDTERTGHVHVHGPDPAARPLPRD
jgi:hypothetical protein